MNSLINQRQNKVNALFMGETDKITGFWFPIKKMTWTYKGGEYLDCTTVCTKGAKKFEELYPDKRNIVTFDRLSKEIKRQDIYNCTWANRMPVNREPDPEMLEIYGLNLPLDPVEYVARSGGYRYGDPNDLFPEIQVDENGNFNFIFPTMDAYTFVAPNKPELNIIEVEDSVNLEEYEGKIKLHCRGYIIGSPPKYILELFKKYQNNLKISIFKKNPKYAFEYQFLCKASLSQEIGVPFTEEDYQPYND